MTYEQNQRVSLGRSRSISYATGKNRVNVGKSQPNGSTKSSKSPLHEELQEPPITLHAPLHSTVSADSVRTTGSYSTPSKDIFETNLLDSNSIPKTLHFSSTIEHLIGRYGAVNLIKQLSTDLAEREAEMSLIRRKNSIRENVMMKLLNEMGLSTNQVELMIKERLEKAELSLPNVTSNGYLKELIGDAMAENLDLARNSSESLSTRSSGKSLNEDPVQPNQPTINNDLTPKKYNRPHSMSSPPIPSSTSLNGTPILQTDRERSDSHNNLLMGVVSHKFLNHMPQTFHDAIINNQSSKTVPVEMENFDPNNTKPPTYHINNGTSKKANEDEDYVDQYGFLYNRNIKPLKTSTSESSFNISITSKLLAMANEYDKSQQQNKKQWDSFIKKISLLKTNQTNDDPDELLIISGENISHYKHLYKEFAKLVSNGIPNEYRTKIWSELTGSKALKTPSEYSKLLDDTKANTEAESQIELDLYRTMPFNVFFKDDGPGLKKLQNILIAISRKYPKIGYCQGMNFIVANLLLVYPNEEDAFWVFVGMIENILPKGLFNLSNIKRDMIILKRSFKEELPKLYEHFHNVNVELDPICFNWMVSLFSDSLPIHLILRIWDNFLLNGYDEIYKISLAIFKIFERHLLQMSENIEIYEFMKNLQKVNFNMKSSDLIRLSSTINVHK